MRSEISDSTVYHTGKRNRGRRFKGFLLFFAILLTAVFLVVSLPAFHLSEIRVSETRMVSRQKIIETSGLITGQHLLNGLGGSMRKLFEFRYGSAEEAISAQIPYVESARVELVFPGRVDITVDERIEVAYLAIPDGCVMIDKEGYALSIVSEKPDDIPVIEGIKVVSLSLGQPLTVSVTESMQGAVTLMGAIIDADRDQRIDLKLMDHVKIIRPAGGNLSYLTISIPGSGEELNVLSELGSGLADDMIWLRFALDQQVLGGYGKGILDLTGEKRIFRPDGG
jgi:cell division septal protein FtsQ